MSTTIAVDTLVMSSTFASEALGAGSVIKIWNAELSPGKLSSEEASTSY